MTDWGYRPGRGEATAAFHEPDDPDLGRPVAIVSWEGDEHLIPHVPAAYFDKILFNLHNDMPAAESLMDRTVGFVQTIDEAQTESMFAQYSDYERVAIPGKGGVLIRAAALRDSSSTKSHASAKAKMLAKEDVLGATTHFKPFLRGQNPTNAELGFWALWDWRVQYLLNAEEFDVLAEAFNNFAYQLDIYRTYGVPGMRDVGQAPLAALMAVASKPDSTEPD